MNVIMTVVGFFIILYIGKKYFEIIKPSTDFSRNKKNKSKGLNPFTWKPDLFY